MPNLLTYAVAGGLCVGVPAVCVLVAALLGVFSLSAAEREDRDRLRRLAAAPHPTLEPVAALLPINPKLEELMAERKWEAMRLSYQTHPEQWR